MFKHFYRKICKPKRILFYRDFTVYTGGHQKVADYFGHLAASGDYDPYISFSAASRWDEFNPWLGCTPVDYLPADYDYIFLAGMDWQKYLATERPISQPIINLIQHVRHADPSENLFQYLNQPAIRICVSQQVADAISGTGRINGPVYSIPNGVDLPTINSAKIYDVVILGIKQSALASAIYEQLAARGLRIMLVNQQVPRNQWFEYLAMSRVALLLPNILEGFYLPALEAMNYCDFVVVPDCVGNRNFCKNGHNCWMPEYNVEAIVVSVMKALGLLQNKHVLTEFSREMNETIRIHSLAKEREAFLKLVGNVKKLWEEINQA